MMVLSPTRQIPQDHPQSFMRAGVQGPNVAPPPQVGSVQTKQEIPGHASLRFVFGVQGRGVALQPQIKTWAINVQDQPTHPSSQLRSQFIGAVAQFSPTRPVQTQQEQPSHPASMLKAAFIVGNVASPMGSIVSTQEQPASILPKVFSGGYFTAAAATFVPSQPVLVALEGIKHPSLRFVFGVQGPNVVPPAVQIPLVIGQEKPDHPIPALRATFGFVAPPVIPAVQIALVIKQEMPDHPRSQIISRGDFTAPPPFVFPRPVLTTQEVYKHPSLRFVFGVQGPNVVPPAIRTPLVLKQELPQHPTPSVRATFGFVAPPVPPAIQIPLIIKQEIRLDPPTTTILKSGDIYFPPQVLMNGVFIDAEQPFHPPPKFTPAIIPGNVAALPQVGRLLTVQELPFHPASRFTPAVIPGNVAAPPQVGKLITTQERPFHPLPSFTLAIIPANVAELPQVGRLLTLQELPFHPPSNLLPSWKTINVAALPQIGSIVTAQEQPYHPLPSFTKAVIPGDVASLSLIGAIQIKQEPPYHPSSNLWPAIIPGDVAALPQIGSIIEGQEQPFHPASQFSLGVPPSSVPIILGMELVTVQEYPWHPSPILYSSYQNPVFPASPNFARLLFNTKIRVRTLVNKTPRTIRYN